MDREDEATLQPGRRAGICTELKVAHERREPLGVGSDWGPVTRTRRTQGEGGKINFQSREGLYTRVGETHQG